jgi:peptidoglycan/LPS O-acetylase OafA/YrhL
MLVLLLGLGKVLQKRAVFLGLFLFLFLIAWLQIDSLFYLFFRTFFRIKWYDATYLALPWSFGLGVLYFLFKDKIRVSLPLATGVLIASGFTDWWLLKVTAWVYCAFCFAYVPKYYIKSLNFKNDISYGIYILSWPIQQTVLHLKLTDQPFLLFAYSMIAIIPMAFASWKLVEKPCLNFKSSAR